MLDFQRLRDNDADYVEPLDMLTELREDNVTLIGRLFDEGTIARAGLAMERAFNVASERPPGF